MSIRFSLFGFIFSLCIKRDTPVAEVEAPVAEAPAAQPIAPVAEPQRDPIAVERVEHPATRERKKPGRKEGWRERQEAKRKAQRVNEARLENLALARAAKALKDAERKAKSAA
jgi:hypothetical protein